MKISLKKLVENPLERDPSIIGTEARKFLDFLKSNNGYSYYPLSWNNIFSEFNEKAAKDFIEDLLADGWIKKDYINQLDIGIFITDKANNLLTFPA